ncbi:MAG: MBL fold metallo-hydrolase [Dermabacter sp.]|nr:MBL fold metallo-hydrolase [Dermabacter sp.]
MDITHYGHSAVLVTYAGGSGGGGCRLLIDPGAFSRPEIRDLRDLDALIITHQHPDHVDPDILAALLAGNPGVRLLAEPQTAEILACDGPEGLDPHQIEPLAAGHSIDVGHVRVTAAGGAHATIHPAIPPVGNIAVILTHDGEPTFAHTGDSLVPHPEILGVDVLAFPVVAPWSKMQETIDFLRIVRPGVALPIHDAVASPPGRGIYMRQSAAHVPEGTELRDWPDHHSLTFAREE